jgi:hypothetical protein
MRKKRVTVTVDEDTYFLIQEVAAKQRRSMHQQLLYYIDRGLSSEAER